MPIELKVPPAGESITEVTLVEWLAPEGAAVERDQPVALIETDKANVELVSPARGVLARALKKAGERARVGEVVGLLDEGAGGARSAAPAGATSARPAAPPATSAAPPATSAAIPGGPAATPAGGDRTTAPAATPASLAAGPGETQRDRPIHQSSGEPPAARALPPSLRRALREGSAPGPTATPAPREYPPLRPTDRVQAMTPLRRRVAERLLLAQSEAALLTTFNEVDMSAVIALRKEHQEAFQKRHGVKLGFMSFFVKATVEALRAFPELNAEIRGDDVVYHQELDIGVAVGGGKGLVVPVLRGADALSFAELEQRIADFGERARAGRLKVAELEGGTFTVSNGGVYGSLMSTPIINPPQSGILGMHAIQERPVARGGAVVVAPMMYIALTYDHRLVDGREAVSFLVRVKECVEAPARLLLGL